jgi:hypothetical protein
MRDPYKVMLGRSTALTLGLKLRAAWEAFEKRHPGATGVAETYGTPDCTLDKDIVQLWKAAMRKTLGANAPPSVRMKPRWKYLSPLDPELFEAWISRASDPDDVIPDWIRNGAPLGIEAEIPVRGIFPKYDDESNMDYQSSKELEDAAAQLGRGEVTNYSSVTDNLDDALIELERYRQEGYLADVSKQVVQDEMSHGTISKLGLIIKEKPEGKKRRIILDLRRSGGNRKAQLPEKLVLPRPKDAVAMIRNNYLQRRVHQADEGYARELAVIDISDAFMSLAVKEAELSHTLAPNPKTDGFVMFCALLFGYKTAPLLWSRIASCLARCLQSMVQGGEAQHQVYLDDGLWILQGTLKERNSVLAMILTTMGALGFKVSLKKGLRSTQVQWVGVRFTLNEDAVILGLPEQFVKDLTDLLKGWENKGMAPLKELRQAAGKLSWLSGILPRARWRVAVFYRVLHDRLNDIATGREEQRRGSRDDTRSKEGLFVVKQLEQARLWLISFLSVAVASPVRKFKLDITKYPKAAIMTDACPLGAGAVLLVNGRIIKAYSTKITHRDARLLQFEDKWEQSASQGIAETFSVLLALKHWERELASCQVELQVQSDSVVALATSQKLASSNPTLNFMGAEMAIQCEKIGIEGLKCSHIPGAANTVADFLSRPDRMAKEEVPSELKGVPVHKEEAPRGENFYYLPPPQLAPELWTSSVAANGIWPDLH